MGECILTMIFLILLGSLVILGLWNEEKIIKLENKFLERLLGGCDDGEE